MAVGLSCSRQVFYFGCSVQDLLVVACAIFTCGMWDQVPCPGMEPGSPALEAWSLSHWTTRKVPARKTLNFIVSPGNSSRVYF